eukprot:6463171-Amphidinium_carterae.1
MLKDALLDAELVRRAIAASPNLGPVDKAALTHVVDLVATDARSITWDLEHLRFRAPWVKSFFYFVYSYVGQDPVQKSGGCEVAMTET